MLMDEVGVWMEDGSAVGSVSSVMIFMVDGSEENMEAIGKGR